VRATKTGTGYLVSAQLAVTPLATCVDGYPCSSGFQNPGLHEMRNTYCVVAFVQSTATWDLSSSYLTMGTGSQKGGQDKIYAALGSNTINIDVRALSWMNSQFKSKSYSFMYIPQYPKTATAFMALIRADIAHYTEMSYVRVALSSGAYGGWKKGGLHATGSTGYDDSAGRVTSYDPFALTSSNGTCSGTSYSSTQTKGCTWSMPQANYFVAMDRSGAGTLPVWW
jgi:hypothetical protein